MFNSREYEWADVNVVIGGRIVTGIRSVKYKESKEKEVLYGKGNKPQGIQHGNYSYDGEVTILQSELQALETAAKAAGVSSILELSMEIVVSYVDPGREASSAPTSFAGRSSQRVKRDWHRERSLWKSHFRSSS